MTDRLSEIARRAEAATPGDWYYGDHGQQGPPSVYVRQPQSGKAFPIPRAKGDGQFIAHARQDVPWLLAQIAERDAEIERLRGELSAIDAVLARRPAIDSFPDRVDKIMHALHTAAKAEPGRVLPKHGSGP